MKNYSIYTLLLFIAAAGFFTSCKKDKKEDGPCGKLEYSERASIAYTRPCGIAISKSGFVAVVEYKGFIQYGSEGVTTIWRSFADFTGNKEPLQRITSIGAEAVTFDGSENLYVAETEATAGIQVYKKIEQAGVPSFHPYRVIRGNALPGGFVNPRGIAFDDKGRLYIANDGVGNLIKVIDPIGAGEPQIIGGQFGDIKGVAIKGDMMYLTGYTQGVVMKCTLKPNGDFGEIVGVYNITKPVDIAEKDGLLAISSPETGLITIIEADKIGTPSKPYDGCIKEITVGKNLFGLAFNPTGNDLLAAHLDQNRILFYQQ